MSDAIALEGKEYIPSKKAAELSGYAQDYIGQLARGGFIEAKRVGGLWYVLMDSLQSYKTNSETRTRTIPPQATDKAAQSVVLFDGTEYVSASKGAEITGYNPDYVGQLARAGTIPSRQVGNRWYVDRDKLVSHKQEKDALLAAVQAQSVGIHQKENTQSQREVYSSKATSHTISQLRYIVDDRELLPSVKSDKESVIQNDNKIVTRAREDIRSSLMSSIGTPRKLDLRSATVPMENSRAASTEIVRPKRSRARFKIGRKYLYIMGGVLILALLVVGIFMFISKGSRTLSENTQSIQGSTSALESSSNIIERIGETFERVLVPQQRYIRSE